ncbi:MAG: glycine/betaine/sarcosine/D-proline family reductase selenoprotein B [Gemmatimonadota bacterium]|nr:glycine/betaine/sarcosine/D-proline family reductase selenoprotein B [Gemmatimonadota bacterium]MDH3366572.1 glycine/betaine/sarcosine/D-proline family reductase selenoprotein B [Gemmatimonadota bacterium]MDH3477727.1 glycine/betaine/sarcosine/D-proline family reductase selenoprotein B [Gemmatimonadota bacterium]MDH3570523.1 glycine/betaine/sarcosine/D-proline family reductase selenoprotein B [Gemmatimonadota bacterium]MDH5548858.1 glycine/betaine/sarcosine/D-proline family reductase selenop
MTRWWNQLMSRVYARVPSLSERYGRRSGTVGEVPLPPLARLATLLSASRVGIVTAGGVHLAHDPPFDMQDPEGDGSFRIIPGDAAAGALRITHDYYDHRAADEDVNCVFPIDRLRELVAAREIGSVAPRHVGLMGHVSGPQLERLLDRSAAEIGKVFAMDGVGLVLTVPG